MLNFLVFNGINGIWITKCKAWLTRPKLAGLALLTAAGNVMASTTGSMPWDSPLKTLQEDLTGPLAAVVGSLAFFVAGAMLVFGREEMHGFVKVLLYIIMGIAVLANGPNIMSTLGINQGALVF